jgi:HEAT repeats
MRKSTLTITCKPRYIQVLALLLSILPALANIKTLAQTPSTQSQCSEVEIKNYIQKLSSSQPSIYNALVACNSQAVPGLIEALKNQDKELRIMAITALGEIGSPSAVAFLSNLLSTEIRRDVRVAVISALSQFGKQGVPTLINALKDKDWYIRYQAANALGEIGFAAKDALPALNDAVKDKNVNVRAAATSTLEEIKKQELCNGSNNSGVNESFKTQQQMQKYCNEETNTISSTNTANPIRHGIGSPQDQYRRSTRHVEKVISNQQSGTSHVNVTINGSRGSLTRDEINPKPPADTYRLGSSISLTKPPLMCRVPALRIIFKWKCSR